VFGGKVAGKLGGKLTEVAQQWDSEHHGEKNGEDSNDLLWQVMVRWNALSALEIDLRIV
jgi:hypothetical protein